MKRKLFLILLCLTYFTLPDLSFAQQEFIRLGWTPNDEPDLAHYVMYRDDIPGTMVYLDSISSSDTLYTDSQVIAGNTYYYKLTAVDFAGNESDPSNEVMAVAGTITMINDNSDIIRDFGLKQNYPNPFNPTTTIEYSIPRPSKVSVTIYNTAGQEIRRLSDEFKEPGSYKIEWDGRDNSGRTVSSGVYFYQMIAGDYKQVMRSIFQK